ADRLRDSLIAWAHGEKLLGFLFVVATCAAAALIAAWLVRRFCPHASGSGIPHVEAVLNAEIPQAPFHLIWVKFCGGVLAIRSGLALGREGPSVQMGASVAHLVGKVCRRASTPGSASIPSFRSEVRRSSTPRHRHERYPRTSQLFTSHLDG